MALGTQNLFKKCKYKGEQCNHNLKKCPCLDKIQYVLDIST